MGIVYTCCNVTVLML